MVPITSTLQGSLEVHPLPMPLYRARNGDPERQIVELDHCTWESGLDSKIVRQSFDGFSRYEIVERWKDKPSVIDVTSSTLAAVPRSFSVFIST